MKYLSYFTLLIFVLLGSLYFYYDQKHLPLISTSGSGSKRIGEQPDLVQFPFQLERKNENHE